MSQKDIAVKGELTMETTLSANATTTHPRGAPTRLLEEHSDSATV
jgi:hypothetical protein